MSTSSGSPYAFEAGRPRAFCIMSQRVATCRKVKPTGEAAGKPSLNRASSGTAQTRSRVIYPWPGRSSGKTEWRAAPTGVEKPGDELRIGVKGQSNSAIAGSLRNLFGQGLGARPPEVEHWMDKGADRLPSPTKLRMPVSQLRETACGR